jgi:hypothetical protein
LTVSLTMPNVDGLQRSCSAGVWEAREDRATASAASGLINQSRIRQYALWRSVLCRVMCDRHSPADLRQWSGSVSLSLTSPRGVRIRGRPRLGLVFVVGGGTTSGQVSGATDCLSSDSNLRTLPNRSVNCLPLGLTGSWAYLVAYSSGSLTARTANRAIESLDTPLSDPRKGAPRFQISRISRRARSSGNWSHNAEQRPKARMHAAVPIQLSKALSATVNPLKAMINSQGLPLHVASSLTRPHIGQPNLVSAPRSHHASSGGRGYMPQPP